MIGLEGLIAATYTPLNQSGELDVGTVQGFVDHLIEAGIRGIYVCGSTGEGMSLSSDERRRVAEVYVKHVDGRIPVVVQVGHNSLAEAASLAQHAHQIGADAISATCPSYYKVDHVDLLVATMAEVASAAEQLPFYYYHIPMLTGSTIDMVSFLGKASKKIGNFTGLKYTAATLHEFQQCVELEDGRYDVVWGFDEMLLGALATGAHAAIGSTYNIAPRLYLQILSAFDSGDLSQARQLQSLSVAMIRILADYPFHSAMKAVLRMKGFDFGACRLPQENISQGDEETLRDRLTAIGFFDWS